MHLPFWTQTRGIQMIISGLRFNLLFRKPPYDQSSVQCRADMVPQMDRMSVYSRKSLELSWRIANWSPRVQLLDEKKKNEESSRQIDRAHWQRSSFHVTANAGAQGSDNSSWIQRQQQQHGGELWLVAFSRCRCCLLYIGRVPHHESQLFHLVRLGLDHPAT